MAQNSDFLPAAPEYKLSSPLAKFQDNLDIQRFSWNPKIFYITEPCCVSILSFLVKNLKMEGTAILQWFATKKLISYYIPVRHDLMRQMNDCLSVRVKATIHHIRDDFQPLGCSPPGLGQNYTLQKEGTNGCPHLLLTLQKRKTLGITNGVFKCENIRRFFRIEHFTFFP